MQVSPGSTVEVLQRPDRCTGNNSADDDPVFRPALRLFAQPGGYGTSMPIWMIG